MFVFINNFEVLNHAEKKKEGWFLTVSDFAWSLQTLTLKTQRLEDTPLLLPTKRVARE